MSKEVSIKFNVIGKEDMEIVLIADLFLWSLYTFSLSCKKVF